MGLLGWSVAGLGLFLLLMSPLVVFDLRHDHMNYNAMKAFFTVRQTTVNLRVDRGGERLLPLAEQVTHSVLTNDNQVLFEMTAATLMATLILGLLLRCKPVRNPGLWILLLWLVMGIGGLSLYKQHIYAHYFEFMFPVIHLLFGWLIWQLWGKGQIWDVCMSCSLMRKVYAGLLVLGVVLTSVMMTPLQWGPNRQYQRTSEIVDDIMELSGGQPFNFGMMAKTNYDESYLYPMELKKAAVVEIDPQIPETITDQLFVVCELPNKSDSPEDEKCNPIGHPQSEIASFGWAKIDGEWDYDWGPILYKLVHLTPEELEEATNSAETTSE